MSGTFMDKSFSVAVGGDQQYRDNWDRIFGQRTSEASPAPKCPHGRWPWEGCDECTDANSKPKLPPLASGDAQTEKAPDTIPEPPKCNCHTINVGDQEHHQFWCARVSLPPLAR